MNENYEQRNYNENREHLPLATMTLIGINIIVFILCAFTGDLLYNKGNFSIYYVLHDHQYYRFITSMFLHLDTSHLAGNMILLYVAGELVEKYSGRVVFTVTYLISGIMGSALSSCLDLYMHEFTESLGASGAVFGLIGALLAIVLIHKGRFRGITMGRMGFMIFFSVYSGFTATNVNNAAHIGGLIAGFTLMLIYCVIRKIYEAGKERHYEY